MLNMVRKSRRGSGSGPGGPAFPVAAVLALLAAAMLAGCGDKSRPAKPGQALVNVNGEEITVLQLNDELQRAGVPATRQEQASKQLLQALIDRELIEHAAIQERLDRDPKVIAAIERARSLIVAQVYMQKRLANVARPTPAEVEAYYRAHPDLFEKRKQFSLDQLVMTTAELTPEVRAEADKARSLEELAVWLDAHDVKYGRSQVTRSTAELGPELTKKLLAMSRNQLFSVREGERAMLLSIAEVREAPVPLSVAAPQIAQFLTTSKQKELAAAEVERLRKSAKIEYLNPELAQGARAAPASMTTPRAAAPGAAALPEAKAATPGAAPPRAAEAAADKPARPAAPDQGTVERGVAGLK